ncbi:MAG: ABC transporter ATP-binding protein [Cytophagales bacterium]|nr:ABC transporter ATP-binding protein [Armatimonadota bacterium]
MASVRVRQLVKRYDQNVAVDRLDLEVEDGEFMVFLGPSGCGKTTTLRCIAGLEIPDSGEITIGEERVTDLPPADRDIAFIFQSFSLYPHMTVRENLSFPLRAVRTAQMEIEARVTEVARVLRIERLLDRKPGKLSGGEMQRVAIGRAIVRRPRVFLMDEPLTALDAKLRTEMRAEIKRLQSDLGATTLYVTHDQLEAMSMGDKIAVMYGGLLQQVGTPTAVYDSPTNLFVAGFIGSPSMNLIPCRRKEEALVLDSAQETTPVSLPIHGDAAVRFAAAPLGATLMLGVRPEDIALSREPKPEFLAVEVYVVEPLGSENILSILLGGHLLKARTAPTFPARVGETLFARVDQTRAHLFDTQTTQRVSEAA